jgi:hypothetical protein
MPEADFSQSFSKLKGTLIRNPIPQQIEHGPRVSSLFTLTDSLHVDKNEDGPPLALFRQLPDKSMLSIVSVADGLGGSGSNQAMIFGEQHSMAFFAARWAQKAVQNCYDHFAEDQLLSQFPDQLRSQLKVIFDTNASGFTFSNKLRGTIFKPFPTTIATATSRIRKHEQEILFMWAGDSPLTLFTPTEIYTTTQSGDGDAPLHSMITLHDQRFHLANLIFPAEVPILVAAATDALLKNPNGFYGLLKTILAGMGKFDPGSARDAIKQQYDDSSSEIDDATYALMGNPSFLNASPFNSSLPVRVISDGMTIRK